MSDNRQLWWRQPFTEPAIGMARQLVVVTDVDGGLLEPGAQALPDERAAIDFLAARGIPLVINSSRTRAEIERLHETLQMLTPFISEHGSALFIPHACFPFVPACAQPAVGGNVIEFGKRYHQVVDVLRMACNEAHVEVVGFSKLAIEEVASELGVSIVDAQLAKLREYSELFRIVDERDAMRSRLHKALRRRGLRCWRVGQQHHLVTATPDRAEALRTLKTLWQDVFGNHIVIGLGDSEDDVAWLQHVDIPVFVQDRRANVPARVLAKLPTVRVTRSPGRRGWSEAVFELVAALLSAGQGDSRTNEVVKQTDPGSNHRPP